MTAAIGQETVNYTLVGDLLTATIATSPDATRIGDTLFTVELVDPSTGDYVVTLVDNVLHGNDANDDEDGIEVQLTIPYQVQDGRRTGPVEVQLDHDVRAALDRPRVRRLRPEPQRLVERPWGEHVHAAQG